MSEIVEKDKKVGRYIEKREYYPYLSLKKIDDGNFDKVLDDLVLIDKDIAEIFNIIGTLNGIKQQILEYLYEDPDPKLEVFLKKEYNKNIDYLNKKKELLLKLKGCE